MKHTEQAKIVRFVPNLRHIVYIIPAGILQSLLKEAWYCG